VAGSLAERAAALLSPLQLGVGVRHGCEAILHTARRLAEEVDNIHIAQADLINAFNVADRGAGLRDIERVFPGALAWARTCYGTDSELLFGDNVILSSVGFQQGDPMASLLFALVLHPVVEAIKKEAISAAKICCPGRFWVYAAMVRKC